MRFFVDTSAWLALNDKNDQYHNKAAAKSVVLIQKNPVKSNMGVHRVLVSLLDFKSSVACQKRARWVRFPHAPARILLLIY